MNDQLHFTVRFVLCVFAFLIFFACLLLHSRNYNDKITEIHRYEYILKFPDTSSKHITIDKKIVEAKNED